MDFKTWNFIDKSEWGPGPWENEPDKVQWLDPLSRLPCLVVRAPQTGSWCGYSGVSKGHPLFGVSRNDVDLHVHGGITYSDFCTGEEQGVCHVVKPGEDDHVWWLGFDCAHGGDVTPQIGVYMRQWYGEENTRFYNLLMHGDHYWTLFEVMVEASRLALQLGDRTWDDEAPGVQLLYTCLLACRSLNNPLFLGAANK